MKKRIRIALIFLTFLSLTSCDFIRTVAGRPTSQQLAQKAHRIEVRRQEIADSLQEIERQRLAAEAKRRDSLSVAALLDSLKISSSSLFSFGQPAPALQYKYNAVVGVYRTQPPSDAQLRRCRAHKYPAHRVYFPGGESAVLLCSSDSISDVTDMIVSARRVKGLCPGDAWIYIQAE